MGLVALAGRALFVLVFLISVPHHFNSGVIGYAASHGLPFAGFFVPASGVIALVGALSVLVGWRARIGASLLVLFLVPVTIVMHNFWAVADPAARQMQEAMFWKNLSILGGALLVAYFGAGPWSLDDRRRWRRFRESSVIDQLTSTHGS